MTATQTFPLHDLRAKIARVYEPLADARHVPGEFYASPHIADVEKERIFLKTWLCVGRVEEIPEVGDYTTCVIADEPFVLARDESREVVAYMNMCLHRGVEVVTGKGNAKDFSCPYHAWLYDIGGNLITAPRMKETHADLKNCRMRRLQSVTWRGWIFVTFNADPVPFGEFIAPFEGETLWWFKTEQCRLAEKMVIEVDCNWKLLVENLVDVYHVPVLHKGTFGGFVKKGKNDAFDVDLLPQGGWAYEQKAKAHSKTGTRTFPILPWLEGMADDTSFRAGIYPNLSLSMRVDSLRMWQVWPVTPSKTRLEIYLMFPEVAFEDPNFRTNLEDYKAFITQLVSEDASMVVSLQRAMKSPFYEPGPLSGLESAVQHIMKNYLDVVTANDMALAPRQPAAAVPASCATSPGCADAETAVTETTAT